MYFNKVKNKLKIKFYPTHVINNNTHIKLILTSISASYIVL